MNEHAHVTMATAKLHDAKSALQPKAESSDGDDDDVTHRSVQFAQAALSPARLLRYPSSTH